MKIIPDSLQIKKRRKEKIKRKGRKLLAVALAVFLSLLGTRTLAQTIILNSIELEHKDFSAQEQVAVDTGLYTLDTPKIEIIDSNGKKVDVSAQVINKKKIILKQKKRLKPGRYRFILYDNNKVIFNEDFTWGVLAINTNKAIYTKGDTVIFAMAVLDSRGNMVCDADVELIVENEDADFKQTLKTSKGEIRINPECKLHDFTLKPDYEARLTTKFVGEYKITLTAKTKAGTYTIYDKFSVEKKPDFDIERRAATRLYPVKEYPVEIVIKANKDFKGKAIEQVPQSFALSKHANARNPEQINDTGETKTLIWHIDLSKDEIISLGYVFDPPDKSPDLFQSGKLKFVREAKIMQDALDAVDALNVTESSESSETPQVVDIVEVLESSGTNESSGSTEVLDTITTPETHNEVNNVQITEFEETRFWIYANDAAGSGSISVTPTSTTTTSIQETFTFTFDPSENMNSGGLAIKVPTSRGWSAPQGSAGSAGYVTASGSGNATVGVSLVTAESDPEGSWNWGEDDNDACNNNTTSSSKVYQGSYSVYCVNFNDVNPDDTDSVSWEHSSTVDWSGYSQIGFWIYSTKDMTSTHGIEFGFDDSADMASPIATTNLDTISANTWTYFTVTLSGTRTAVKSFGLISNGSGFDNSIIYLDEVIIGSSALTYPANGSDQDIQMRFVDLASTETVTVTYGATGGTSGVTPPSTTGTDTFTTRTMITSADSFVNISSHPTIQVNDGITVSGTCKQSDQSTNCTDVGSIRVATNSTLQTPTQATVAGTWTVYGIPKPSTNDVITVFISGAGEGDEAVGVTTYDGSGNVGDIALIAQRLTIGNSDARTISNTNLNQYDSGSTEDIFHTVNDSTYEFSLTVDGNKPSSELYIISGNTYRPDSSTPRIVNAHDFEINGTFTADSTTSINVSGSWDNNGTFSAGSSTTTFTGTTSETIDMGGAPTSNSFNNVAFNGSGGNWTLNTAFDVNGTLTITTGTLTQSSMNITVGSNVLVNTNGIFTKGSGTFTFDGTTAATWTNNGTIDNLGAVTINKTDTVAPTTNNKVTLGSSVKADTVTINGTSGQADTLDLASSSYTLELANTGATATVLTVSGTLTIGTSTIKYSATNSGGNVNINNLPYSSLEVSGAETYVLTGNQTSTNAITNNITIGTGATLDVTTAPYSITLNGNWSNSGTFTARTGTVSIGGSGTSTLSGTTTFYTFNSTAAGKTIKFQKHTANVPYFTFSNQFILTGASGNKINLESDTNGSQWLANFSSAQTGTTYVNLKDAGCYSGTSTINMSGTGNSNVSGNNTACWIFNTAPNSPSSLAQTETNDDIISTGQWINQQSVKFTVTASDTDNPDTLYLCVEIDQVGTSFSNTEDSCASSGSAYSGSPITLSHTVTSIPGDYSYHWQARVKDADGSYSAWVSYGGNAESARDFGVDLTAPTGGTVYDGSSIGSDQDFNDGTLNSLSGNWGGFSDPASGISAYYYMIGTTALDDDVAVATYTGLTTQGTTNSLNLQTSKLYYISVYAVDSAGNIQTTISSDGLAIAPTLNFAVSPSSVTFANLNAVNSYTDTETTTITTSTNAYNGYVVRAFQSSVLTSFSNPSLTISNFSGGSYASPDEFLSGDLGFGYTSSDTSVQGSNKFGNSPCAGGGNPPCYAPFSLTSPGDIVADHTSNVSGTPISNEQFTITYKVRVNEAQAATKYSTNIIYTVIPTF